MTEGQTVIVKLYGGSTARRRVVAIKENVVVICSEEEYQTATRQGRSPEGLGFPWEDVMEEVFMNFPTALAKSTPRPVPSMDLPLETASAEAQPADGASAEEKAGPSTTKTPAAPPTGKSGPKDLASFHAKVN